MFEWFRRAKRLPPLTGAPAVRREKTYSARSGYVYQYHYEGQRPANRSGQPGTEFVFLTSADRKTSFPVSVFLSEAAIEQWEEGHGRNLAASERYAISKLGLFQAFDERPDPASMRDEVRLRAADVSAILETLGVD